MVRQNQMERNPAGRLRELLASPDIVIAPGVANAFHAKLAEKAGFSAIFATGAGIANTWLGVPDLGLTSMTEVVNVTARIVESTELPVIADADTGYGNHLNVMRTTQELERIGVAGFFIEDQASPKKCGHFEGKRVIPIEEMVQKIVAARIARKNPDLVLIARTDAIAVEGLDAALDRAHAYVEAGADVIFVEAPTSLEELAAIPASVPVPCLANMVEGGKTPLVPADELRQMGYRLVTYANLALRLAARAVEHGFSVLRRDGSSVQLLGEMFTWEERQETVGLSHWRNLDQRIARESREILAAAEH